MEDKKKYIFRKKNIPTILSGVSFFLALVWIYIIFSGIIKEFDVEAIKTFNGKKIVFALTNDKMGAEAYQDQKNLNATYNNKIGGEKIFASIIVELDDYSFFNEVLKGVPAGTTFGLTSDNENFLLIKEQLNVLNVNYLIKLPLTNYYTNNPYSLYPKIDPLILSNRLDALMSGSKAAGVYNIGNEEFLENDLASFANIVAFLNQKNLFMVYGVHNQTTIFESDSENIFSVEACDQVLDVRLDNRYQLLNKLKIFEEAILAKGKGVLFIKAVDYNLPDEIIDWLKVLEKKHIEVVSPNSLPRTLHAKG